MAKIFLILILFAPILTTCSHRWIAHPQNIKDYEKCRVSGTGPQMLKVPGYDRSYIMVYNCNVMDRQRVSIGITIFGGMLFSTFFTLYVIPTVYTIIGKNTKRIDAIEIELNKQLKK